MNPMSFVILRKHLAEKEKECKILYFGVKFLSCCCVLITVLFVFYYYCNHNTKTNNYKNVSTTEGVYNYVYISEKGKWTATTSGYDKPENKTVVSVVDHNVIASGACVDKALSILLVLERNNKLDDTIYLAVGEYFGAWHVQVVKINKSNEENNIVYYDLKDFDVVTGNTEFSMPPPVFYKPEVFREAAMKYKDLNYVQMRDFATKYTASK